MPRTTQKAAVRIIREKDGFNILHVMGGAVITLLVGLLGSGIVSTISLYIHMAELTQQVQQTSATLARHLDHSVDKESYDKRDASIQKQLNEKATKDEVEQLRTQVKEELIDLKDTIHTMQEGFSHSRH